jgi:tetratricopeptide (TPR) repeat protein
MALFSLGRYAEGRPVMEAVLPALERAGDLETLIVALRHLSWGYLSGGSLERGRAYRERAVEVAERLGDPAKTAVELGNLAVADIIAGTWDAAAGRLAQAVELMRSLGTPPAAAYPLLARGILGLLQGTDLDGAYRDLDEFTAIALRAGDIGSLWQVEWVLAERDLFFGEHERALARFAEWSHMAEPQHEEGTPVHFLLRVRGELLCAAGQLDHAEPLLHEAAELSRVWDDKVQLLEVFRVLGIVKGRQGDPARAESWLLQARDLGRQTRYLYGEARVVYEIGMLHARNGQKEQGRQWLEEAHAIFSRLGATLNAKRTEEMLASEFSG